jgi:peroxiredoxin
MNRTIIFLPKLDLKLKIFIYYGRNDKMINKIFLILIGLLQIVGCSKDFDEIVMWKPDQPKVGEKMTVIFNPQRLVKTEQQELNIFLVYQFVQEPTIKTFKVPMVNKKRFWKATIDVEPGTFLIRLKFEDQMDRVEDNNGYGWNIIVRDENGNVAKNTHYKLGLIYSQEKGSASIPDYAKVDYQFKQELAQFPDNYQVWFDLWTTRLKKFNWSQEQLSQVKFQLDSLLINSERNADLMALAYNSYGRLLKDQKSALNYGQIILLEYENFPKREEIEYSMIFLKNRGNPEAIVNELVKFSKQAQSPTYLKNAYYQLGLSFQNLQQIDESIKYFQKYVELEPDDLPIRLNLANLFIRNRNYEMAQQMMDQAHANNTDKIYFRSHPWEDPQQRRTQLNLSQCQILSTQAALQTALNKFQLAIQNRRKVIELGTPFPAFEWVKIGDLHFQLGQLDSAQRAYVKAVSINSAQEDAIQKLRFYYQLKNKTTVGFETYLQNEINNELRASAKSAPDFELVDLEGNLSRLSEQSGKIVVLTFWDSWSSACQREIPQLNTLVEEFTDIPTVIFWAISVEAPISINKFIRENPFQFHLFHSGYGVKKLFNVIGFPTHIIVDPSGKIRYTHIGYSDKILDQLKKEIQSILKEEKLIS